MDGNLLQPMFLVCDLSKNKNVGGTMYIYIYIMAKTLEIFDGHGIWFVVLVLPSRERSHIPPNGKRNMDVSKSRGTSKWMVYNGKPY